MPDDGSMTGKDIVLFTLGGTIAMSEDGGGGVVARLGGRELMAGIDGLDPGFEVRDLAAAPSASLSFIDILEAVDAAQEAVSRGGRGIVLTQGTDSLEETAFLIDAVWTGDTPFVVTGAMRNPTLLGADGPANLLAAIRTAGAPDARGRGALVVLNDEIHAARHVRKAHSTSTATFSSPDLGPIGHLIEGSPRFLARLPRLPALTAISREALADTRVALQVMTLDDDGILLDPIAQTHQGLVLAAFGVGHVPGHLAPLLGQLAASMPVVLTSRTGAGPVLANTYGAAGAERDLLARGLINGGMLHPFKARILLRLLIASGAGQSEISATFAEYGAL
jgi:L-asparaginase/Glu-tRNA(Gln) amidotransferase subunit D